MAHGLRSRNLADDLGRFWGSGVPHRKELVTHGQRSGTCGMLERKTGHWYQPCSRLIWVSTSTCRLLILSAGRLPINHQPSTIESLILDQHVVQQSQLLHVQVNAGHSSFASAQKCTLKGVIFQGIGMIRHCWPNCPTLGSRQYKLLLEYHQTACARTAPSPAATRSCLRNGIRIHRNAKEAPTVAVASSASCQTLSPSLEILEIPMSTPRARTIVASAHPACGKM